MAVILSNRVRLYRRFSFGSRAAVMELHDSGRFVLGRLAPGGAAVSEMIFDGPMSALTVTGSTGQLTISVNRVKWHVDFASETRPLAALGLVGAVIGAGIAGGSGIESWVATFKNYGVPTRYTAIASGRRILVVTGVALAACVVFLAGTVIYSLLLH